VLGELLAQRGIGVKLQSIHIFVHAIFRYTISPIKYDVRFGTKYDMSQL
jgi:hypothetical protein